VEDVVVEAAVVAVGEAMPCQVEVYKNKSYVSHLICLYSGGGGYASPGGGCGGKK